MSSLSRVMASFLALAAITLTFASGAFCATFPDAAMIKRPTQAEILATIPDQARPRPFCIWVQTPALPNMVAKAFPQNFKNLHSFHWLLLDAKYLPGEQTQRTTEVARVELDALTNSGLLTKNAFQEIVGNAEYTGTIYRFTRDGWYALMRDDDRPCLKAGTKGVTDIRNIASWSSPVSELQGYTFEIEFGLTERSSWFNSETIRSVFEREYQGEIRRTGKGIVLMGEKALISPEDLIRMLESGIERESVRLLMASMDKPSILESGAGLTALKRVEKGAIELRNIRGFVSGREKTLDSVPDPPQQEVMRQLKNEILLLSCLELGNSQSVDASENSSDKDKLQFAFSNRTYAQPNGRMEEAERANKLAGILEAMGYLTAQRGTQVQIGNRILDGTVYKVTDKAKALFEQRTTVPCLSLGKLTIDTVLTRRKPHGIIEISAFYSLSDVSEIAKSQAVRALYPEIALLERRGEVINTIIAYDSKDKGWRLNRDFEIGIDPILLRENTATDSIIFSRPTNTRGL